ncbi:hypothetical protein [Streptomyces sp. NPDC056387]
MLNVLAIVLELFMLWAMHTPEGSGRPWRLRVSAQLTSPRV